MGLGYLKGVGGDTVVYHLGLTGSDEEMNLKISAKKTSQFKVTDADEINRVEDHIAKAAWQLTGAGGEMPERGSKRTIEVIIQSGKNPDRVEGVHHRVPCRRLRCTTPEQDQRGAVGSG